MALQTKEFIGSTSSSLWTYKIVVTENSVDEDNETSSITVENFIGRGSSSSYFMGTLYVTYSAGGQTYTEEKYISSGTIGAGSYFSLGSLTFSIPHTEDRTTISVSGSMSTSQFNPSSGSASGEITLTEIEKGRLRIGVNNEYKKAIPYLGVNGVWKKCKAYIGVNNTWKKGE